MTWLSLREAAALLPKTGTLQRSPRFLAREVAANRLRAARIGGRNEIITTKEWLDEYLIEQATPIQVGFKRRA